MSLGRAESKIRRAIHLMLVANKAATDDELLVEARRVGHLMPQPLPLDDDTLKPVVAAVRESRRTRGHAEGTALDPNVRRLAYLAGLSTDEAIVCLEGAQLHLNGSYLTHELLVYDADKCELIRQHCLAALQSAMPRMFHGHATSVQRLSLRLVPADAEASA